jgi:alkylation response protein AidB-like acyl-CoA dehydrogenase
MDFKLSEDDLMFKETAADLAAKRIRPHAEHWDRETIVPHEAVTKLAEHGFLGMSIPEEWGGVGYDARTIALVIEEIARVSAALAIMVSVHNSVGAVPVLKYGNEEQRRRFLPRLVSKELSAFCISEPAAGSDAGHLQSTAVRTDGHYTLNGSKNWVTNGVQAGIYLIFARTDPKAGNKGISAFVVERARDSSSANPRTRCLHGGSTPSRSRLRI